MTDRNVLLVIIDFDQLKNRNQFNEFAILCLELPKMFRIHPQNVLKRPSLVDICTLNKSGQPITAQLVGWQQERKDVVE